MGVSRQNVTMIVLNAHTVSTVNGDVKIKFKDFYAYRYLIATVIVGMSYTLLQTAFSISLLTTGNRPWGEGFCVFEFYGDKLFPEIF
ncbi:hypothetical protein KY285_019669 [Solanum tuberosum]|nr:hypothetical protein KY285_019669 [Solanum tuberosum]